eukprot:1391114-Heterocapsa_arctica.AAC.1
MIINFCEWVFFGSYWGGVRAYGIICVGAFIVQERRAQALVRRRERALERAEDSSEEELSTEPSRPERRPEERR